MFGFEANPKHLKRLQALEKAYRALGWKVRIQNRVVYNDSSEIIPIYTDKLNRKEDWGAGIQQNKEHTVKYDVQAIDIAGFVKETSQFYKPEKTFAKMDIEGSEYIVLPHLYNNGILCEEYLKIIAIEMHPQFRTVPDDLKLPQLRELLERQNCEPTQIVKVDDETYLHDVDSKFGA